jgi:hypothetical protein
VADEEQGHDWEAIEKAYRAGQLSIREIARQHHLSEGAIRKKAKADEWERDLTAKVRAAVRTELVRTEVRTSNAHEREAINEAAARGAEVVRGHRRDITAARHRVDRLGHQVDRLAGRIEGMEPGHENFVGELNAAATIAESLARTTARLIPLERQAFNLDEDRAPDPTAQIPLGQAEAAMREYLHGGGGA